MRLTLASSAPAATLAGAALLGASGLSPTPTSFRGPLQEFAALSPDFAVLRGVTFGDSPQDDLLAQAAVRPEPYLSFRARRPGTTEGGLAILVGAGQALAHEQARLARDDVAQRVLVQLPLERTLWITNLHLAGAAPIASSERLLSWLTDVPPADASVICGLFEAGREQLFHSLIDAAGYRSCCPGGDGPAAHGVYLTGQAEAHLSPAQGSASFSLVTLEL